MELTERKKKILRALVEQYIQTAEPVGSKALVDNGNLGVSSATIRNEMADLLNMGLLEQPHTSAGRIPSATGYRFYVNELMEDHRLSMQETQSINDALHLKIREMDQVMGEVGKVISQITKYPTFSLTAGSGKVTITRFDLIRVDEHSFITVLLTSTQVVKNKFMHPDGLVEETQLQLLSTLLNANFTGKMVEELMPELVKMSAHATGEAFHLIKLVVSFASEVLHELENSVVHTAGIPNLLAHPEYQSLDSAEPLMNFLTEWGDSSNLPAPKEDAVKILIGPENVAEELKNTSIIMARYDIGDGMQGVIGVVGPTRMDYAKLAARLSYFAEGLSRMFGHSELPNMEKDDIENN